MSSTITVQSLEDLRAHEPEILGRIAQTVNGGNLFLAHPFLLLADIGVELGENVQAELIRRVPQLAFLSRTPYDALKSTTAPQPAQVRLHGLFPGTSK